MIANHAAETGAVIALAADAPWPRARQNPPVQRDEVHIARLSKPDWIGERANTGGTIEIQDDDERPGDFARGIVKRRHGDHLVAQRTDRLRDRRDREERALEHRGHGADFVEEDCARAGRYRRQLTSRRVNEENARGHQPQATVSSIQCAIRSFEVRPDLLLRRVGQRVVNVIQKGINVACRHLGEDHAFLQVAVRVLAQRGRPEISKETDHQDGSDDDQSCYLGAQAERRPKATAWPGGWRR